MSYSINYLEKPQKKIQANDLGVLAEAEGSSDSDNIYKLKKNHKITKVLMRRMMNQMKKK